MRRLLRAGCLSRRCGHSREDTGRSSRPDRRRGSRDRVKAEQGATGGQTDNGDAAGGWEGPAPKPPSGGGGTGPEAAPGLAGGGAAARAPRPAPRSQEGTAGFGQSSGYRQSTPTASDCGLRGAQKAPSPSPGGRPRGGARGALCRFGDNGFVMGCPVRNPESSRLLASSAHSPS